MAYYLGIDAGTQSLKGFLIDPVSGKSLPPVSVHFGRELPQYHSPDGVLKNDDPKIVHADPVMWLDALDLLFQKMVQSGWQMSEIRGIAGSGQQHGTVYLNSGFEQLVSSLQSDKSLAEQLAPALSRKTAPVWMDASTDEDCKKLRAKFGKKLRRDTGSDAAERFSGPQIMRFIRTSPEEWKNTSVIHLVSSFLASVIAGTSAPIDYGDGAGMNLLNLHTMDWDPEILDFISPELKQKLPPCRPPDTCIGKVSPYFCKKYGLPSDAVAMVWSGDNPNSLIGCGGAKSGTAVISLGTSDTFFGTIDSMDEAPEHYGHIFGNPAGGFMSLVCFSNGSLAREKMRAKYHLTYESFDEAAETAEPGKALMLPYFVPETTPFVPDPKVVCTFDEKTASPGVQIRALLESQLLTMRFHAELKHIPSMIRITGGASADKLLPILAANVFQAPVLIGESAETAALGAAMRAANGIGKFSFDTLTDQFCNVRSRIEPDRSLAQLYDEALVHYIILAEAH